MIRIKARAIAKAETIHILQKVLRMMTLRGTFHLSLHTSFPGSLSTWIISSFTSTVHGLTPSPQPPSMLSIPPPRKPLPRSAPAVADIDRAVAAARSAFVNQVEEQQGHTLVIWPLNYIWPGAKVNLSPTTVIDLGQELQIK